MNYREKLENNYYQDLINESYRASKVTGNARDRLMRDAEIREEFRKDMEDFHGVTAAVPQKKRDLLYRLAWDYGHSAGYTEVDLYYSELVDLVL
jgi:hypothetical protein